MFAFFAAIYAFVLLTATLAAVLWGGFSERFSVAALAGGWVASLALFRGEQGWLHGQVGVLAIDFVVLILLTAAMLRSPAAWLYGAVALQLAAVLVHIAYFLAPGGATGYNFALQFCTWMLLLMVFAGCVGAMERATKSRKG